MPLSCTCQLRQTLKPQVLYCLQMAARDTGLGAVEQYMHQGKLLALDLLYRVLSDPHHSWSHARPQVRLTTACSHPQPLLQCNDEAGWRPELFTSIFGNALIFGAVA